MGVNGRRDSRRTGDQTSQKTYLHIGRVDELLQQRQRGAHEMKGRRGLASAEVGQSPRGVADRRQPGMFRESAAHLQEGLHGPLLEDVVAAAHAVAGHIAQRPGGLLAHILVGGAQQLHEDGHGAGLDDVLRVLGRARGDVGQGPGGLKLKRLNDQGRCGEIIAEEGEKR